MSEQWNILVVEDDEAVAKGLVVALQQEGFRVNRAENGKVALDYMDSNTVQLVLLDIRMPVMDGFEMCKRLRESGDTIPVIMLTARDEEADRVLGLDIGADDYVVKPFSFPELLSRIRAQLRRAYGAYSSAGEVEKIQFADIVVDYRKLQVFKDEKDLYLTPIEFKLLRYLLDHRNMPISRKDLIGAVWGENFILEDQRTVDVHIRHLREKIEDVPSQPDFITTVRGYGYRFSGEIRVL
ncbi:MAG: response regulator transcription factor [Spirochaetales bacterium]|nr:response regulator transcription factor [Spirochaetales bacterium]